MSGSVTVRKKLTKTRTMEHMHDVWKVIESGRAKFGENWYGSRGYSGADAFAKHFAHLCRDCRNYNEVRAKMKEIMQPKIVWKGERIQCMKSARTSRCKLCMKERRKSWKGTKMGGNNWSMTTLTFSARANAEQNFTSLSEKLIYERHWGRVQRRKKSNLLGCPSNWERKTHQGSISLII